jgi:putative ABC transport system permease protein
VLRLAWSGVRHNTGRYIATLIAIITGIAFFAATGFLSDRVIDSLEGDVNREFGAVDAAVVPDDSGDAASEAFVNDLRLSGETYDRIATADGVEGTAGILTGTVGFLADDGTTFGDGATGRLWVADEELNPLQLVEGTAPTAPGELTVDRGLADEESLQVSDPVTVLTQAGQFDATIVGITAFGSADSIDDGGTVTLPEATAFDWLAAGQVEYEDIYLRGSSSQDDLVAAVEPLVPDGFQAQTGEAFLEDQRAEIGAFGAVLKQGLQAFALLALFVGGFVIYNTFSVIVAQRLRELAVLAAVGATPKQIKRSLRFEGLVIGVVGSALGVVVGAALTFGLIALLSAFGVALPGSGIKVTPQIVYQGLFLGTAITLFSVMIPARRAARTEPIEALRDTAVEAGALTRRRVVTSAVLVALGVGGLLLGGNGAAVGLGALALFIGVIVSGPILAAGSASVLKPLLSRFGLEVRLAVDNTARNPKRTATTSNALLIGVFLVTLVTVAGTSLKDFAVGEIQKLDSADYLISSDGGTIDDELVADLSAIEGVETVVPFRAESVTIDDVASRLSTGDLDQLTEVANLEVKEGSLDDLAAGTIAVIPDALVTSGEAASEAVDIGSVVTVTDASGDSADLEVVALLENTFDTATVGSLVAAETFDDLVGDTAPTVAFISVQTGAQTDTTEAIEDRTALRPDISVMEGNAIGQLIGSIFDFLIKAVDGLLLMSVIVALIGIVNTLSLSILERRRELGLLRVVGMVDKRVQRMVQLESVLIAGLGTLSGIVLGSFVGWSLIQAIDRLSDAGIAVSIPWLLLLGVLVLGVALGMLASYIPSRRSTRLEVLDAIAST